MFKNQKLTMNNQHKITIYYNDREIILWENSPEFEKLVENLKIDEPFVHKCSDRMFNILDVFFDNPNIENISFEYPDLNKLFYDFKSHFKYIEAAGGLVKNKNNELLVIHRFGIPDLPKGKIEPNENPKKAAIREVEEECGITGLKITGEAEPSYHIYFNKGKRTLKKTLWFRMVYSGKEMLIPQAEEDITKAEWCNAEKLKEYRNKTYKNLRKYFQTYD